MDGPSDSSVSGNNDRGGVMCAYGGESTRLRQANSVPEANIGCSRMYMDTCTTKELDGVAMDPARRYTTAGKGATLEWQH